MPSLSSILGNPLTEVMSAAKGIISEFVADPTQKLAASEKLAELQATYQAKLVDADMEYVKAQADVIMAEAKSESWIARNWRPITMLVFVFIIAYDFILAQIFSLKLLPIPEDLWALIKLGLGGYVIGRSAEKIAATYSQGKVGVAEAGGDDKS